MLFDYPLEKEMEFIQRWLRACKFFIPAALLLFSASGCATVPYRYGVPESRRSLVSMDYRGQIERGRPHGFVDGLGNYFFSLPSKLILWNRQVDNHHISPHTEESIRRYLAANRMGSVKVRLNQYAPGGEWIRLARNRDMPGFFRWTVGALTVGMYTILPGRVFGGDNYNPYTNTVSLYSDLDAIALHEAAHAKDFAVKPRGGRGWYALMRILPLAPLYQEARASGDAIGYCIDRGMDDSTAEAYRVLYPAYMTYIAGEPFRWFPAEAWMSYAAEAALALPGHVLGRIKAGRIKGKGTE